MFIFEFDHGCPGFGEIRGHRVFIFGFWCSWLVLVLFLFQANLSLGEMSRKGGFFIIVLEM